MKCYSCGNRIEEIFLGKIKGTYIGKKVVCSQCQKLTPAEELKKKL